MFAFLCLPPIDPFRVMHVWKHRPSNVSGMPNNRILNTRDVMWPGYKPPDVPHVAMPRRKATRFYQQETIGPATLTSVGESKPLVGKSPRTLVEESERERRLAKEGGSKQPASQLLPCEARRCTRTLESHACTVN